MRSRLGLVVGSLASRSSGKGSRGELLIMTRRKEIPYEIQGFWLQINALLAILPAVFLLVPGPAAAQKMATEARNTLPSNPAPAAPTPMSTDGHPDLTGLWWAYRGVNLDVKQVGNTTINLQPTSRAPESEDPENNLSVNTRIYDSVAARRADPNKPSYKPEMIPKVERLDRIEAKVDPAMHCKLPGIVRSGPPQQIVQGPGVVVFLYDSPDASYDAFRIIPTDGHAHRTAEVSNGLSPSYMGDSIGAGKETRSSSTQSISTATSGWESTDG